MGYRLDRFLDTAEKLSTVLVTLGKAFLFIAIGMAIMAL